MLREVLMNRGQEWGDSPWTQKGDHPPLCDGT